MAYMGNTRVCNNIVSVSASWVLRNCNTPKRILVLELLEVWNKDKVTGSYKMNITKNHKENMQRNVDNKKM
jgi:hypothetical protein